MENDNDEVSYLTINHKNTIREIDKEEQRFQTLELFTTLSSIEEDVVGNNINTFFNEILPENNTTDDVLSICKAIASKEKIDKETIANGFDVIMNKTFPLVFSFNKNNINDLFIVLIGVFRIIKGKYSSITSLNQLKTLCKTFNMSKYKKDVLKQFRIVSNIDGNDNDGNTTNDTNGRRNGNGKSNVNHSPTTSVPNCFLFTPTDRKYSSLSKNSCQSSNTHSILDKQLYMYKYRETKYIQYALPIEVMIILLKFETVRQLKLSLKDIDESLIRPSILILFNISWIFENAIEIEVDLSHESIYRDMEKYYNIKLVEIAKLSKKMVKNTNYDSGFKTTRLFKPSYELKVFCNFNSQNDNQSDNDNDDNNDYNEEITDNKSCNTDEIYIDINNLKYTSSNESKEILAYVDIIKNHKAIFEMTIIYSYFLSQMSKIYIMSIILPDSFSPEVMSTLKERNIVLLNYHFFSFLNNFTSLLQLTCDINSLDSGTFEKLIGLIYKNQSLKTLNLSLFPPEEFFSPEMLLKLISSLGFNFNSIFPKKVSKLNTDVSINEEMDNMIMNKLIDPFEINMQTLFSLIEQKRSLNEFVLLLDLPSLVFNNESYTMILMKFFFNLLIFLQSSQCNLSVFSILSPSFRFDNRKYPIISSFFEKIDLFQSKVSKVKRYTLQCIFFSVYNLYRIIPSSVRILAIGELDSDTFTYFIDHFASKKNKDKDYYPHITTIKISLSKTITAYANAICSSIKKLLTSYPRSLKEVYLFSWIKIKEIEYEELMSEINYNSLEKCQFEFGRKNISDDSNKDRECYYIIHTTKVLWRIIRVMNKLSKVNKAIMHKKIYDLIDRFVNKKVKKDIKVTFKNTL